jgi:hypothetical protein
MNTFIIIVWILIILTFFLSSKIIALETLLIFQFAYGGLMMMRNIEPLMIPYQKLWVFNGYNRMDGLENNLLPANIKLLGYGS